MIIQVLYGHVGISIHPHRKDKVSKDMLSWFPLFFPFKVRTSRFTEMKLASQEILLK